MTRYVLKRIVYMIVVFLILSLLMYMLYNLIPTDPARAQLEPMRRTLKPEQYEEQYKQLRREMGLDDPLLKRYARWMGLIPDMRPGLKYGQRNGLLQGNFGYSSLFKQDVRDVITEPMKNTVFINIFATILALGITIPLGIKTAVKRNSRLDKGVQVFSIIGYSIPIFIISLVFIYFLAVLFRVFPVMGMKTPGSNYTGFRAFLDKLYYISLPLIVMTFASLGGMTRYVRVSMIDALSMDYIRTARAKGVREKVVIYSHAWRNALLPVVTIIIGWFLGIFGGSIVVESTFSLNGTGRLYIQGLLNNDYELALAMQMFYTIISLVGTLLTDLSYGLIDPRVRVNK
ncbi:MAG: ABC transporter permease [Clostridiales bacterium]|nr:ABC transporter permease [Clostridiales bacterium]